jgi:hypothetical protein
MGQAQTAQTYFDEESGEMMLDLPQEIITELGLEVDDLLQWSIDDEGRVVITRYVNDPASANEMVTKVVERKPPTDK